ncbi:MAG: DUF1592 domain-containing protein [Rubripirellula sp.]|nr:DUF1592 domain-containing protein [Rubripirellula sp.]
MVERSYRPTGHTLKISDRVVIVRLSLLVIGFAAAEGAFAQNTADIASDPNITFESDIRPLLDRYCVRCHGEKDEIQGEINLRLVKTEGEIDAAFGLWQSALELIEDGIMPPADEPQPTAIERDRIRRWYQSRFIDDIAPHPGFFRPRRLSAHEYRNTLESVLGLELDVLIREAEQTVTEKSLVMKLLPTDPPGPSGFKNDTSANPLTSTTWEQYTYLVDNGLQRLFAAPHRETLESYLGPLDGELTRDQAEQLIRLIAFRARRRSVSDQQLQASLRKIKNAATDDLMPVLQSELKAVLMSPTFLYRGLLMNVPRDRISPVDDFELAERLSYFLWADMPDAELLGLAEKQELQKPDTLHQQVDRMLESPKARSLAIHLGVEWLTLDEIEHVSNNPPVADALRIQPIDFLHYLFTTNRPIVELIDSDVAFINAHTAKYYPLDRSQLPKYKRPTGIEVERLPNTKIVLRKTPERGGLLTMPGILAMNKGPIMRGTWVLERILGQDLPEPPADVGQIPANRRGENLTFRQRFEMHRKNPNCAACHDKIDPLGFALQQYDAGGGFRRSPKNASKKQKLRASQADQQPPNDGEFDTSGRLPNGETFQNFAELQAILVTSEKQRILRNVVQRFLCYALCRKLEPADRITVDAIVQKVSQGDGTFGTLIHAIVESLPFRQTIWQSIEERP